MTRGLRLAPILVLMAIGALVWALRPTRENFILITIDTMRPDRMSAYGYTKIVTPNLDRLAKEGVLFENAFCDVTWTTPSMTSVMTGLYASKHLLQSSYRTLKPEATTLAKVMRDHDYETAAIIASYPLHSIFGLNQGFNLYDQEFSAPLMIDAYLEFGPPPPKDVVASQQVKDIGEFLVAKASSDAYRPDPEVSARVLRWLQNERGQKPFFLWIHYFGPHEKPTGIADVYAEREAQMQAYDPDVIIADAAVGQVLDALDAMQLTDHTTVILNADHAQSLGEHQYFGHGRDVYEATQHIPLIIRSPRHGRPGRRVSGIARNVDLLPTVLELAGMEVPPGLDGTSLVPTLTEARIPDEQSVYVETYLSATSLFANDIDPATNTQVGFRRLGVRTNRWRYVINDPIPLVDRAIDLPDELRRRYYTTELYDMTTDPGETANVILDHHDLAEKFTKEIWAQQHDAGLSTAIVLDDPSRERLRALGYLAN